MSKNDYKKIKINNGKEYYISFPKRKKDPILSVRPIITYIPEIELEYECDIQTIMYETFTQTIMDEIFSCGFDNYYYNYYLEDISDEEYELILLKEIIN